jgi:hypothetical protein
MLINPNRVQLETIPGTRILKENFGLSGFQYIDPREPWRAWILQYLYEPIRRRRLNGIRAKFMDNRGFISFCNQRDLEVLLGIARPGAPCHWADMDYMEVGEPGWFGLCVDDEDLEDDLLERELRLRENCPGVLPPNTQIQRRVHNAGSDYEELYLLLSDWDPVSGISPDPRLETISKRWVRVEKVQLKWELAEI